GARNVQLVKRVFVAVRPLDGGVALDGRLRQEGEVGVAVLKYDRPIVRVNAFFHGSRLRGNCADVGLVMLGITAGNGNNLSADQSLPRPATGMRNFCGFGPFVCSTTTASLNSPYCSLAGIETVSL